MNKRFESLLISATLLSSVALVTTSQLATTVQADTFDKIPPTSQSDINKALDYIKAHPYDAGDTHGKIVLQKDKPIIYPEGVLYMSSSNLPDWKDVTPQDQISKVNDTYNTHLYLHINKNKVIDLSNWLNGNPRVPDVLLARKFDYHGDPTDTSMTVWQSGHDVNQTDDTYTPIGLTYEGRKVKTHKFNHNGKITINTDIAYYFKREYNTKPANVTKQVKIKYYDFNHDKLIHTQILTGKQGSTVDVKYDPLPKKYYYLNQQSKSWTYIFPYNYLFLLYGNKYTFADKNPDIIIPVSTDDNVEKNPKHYKIHNFTIEYIDIATGKTLTTQHLPLPMDSTTSDLPLLYPATNLIADSFSNGFDIGVTKAQFMQAVKSNNIKNIDKYKDHPLSLSIASPLYSDYLNDKAKYHLADTMYIAVDPSHLIMHPIEDPTLVTHFNPVDPNANKGKNKADNVPLAKHSPVDANANKGVKKTIQPTNVNHSSTQSSSVTNSNNNSAQAKSTSSQSTKQSSTNALSQQPNLNQSTNSINTDQSQKLNQNQLMNDQFKSSNDSNKVVNDSAHDVPTSEPEKEKSKPVKEKSTTESAQSQPASKQSVTQSSSDMQKPSKTNKILPQTGENKPVLGTLIAIFSGTILTLMHHFQIKKH